MKVIDDCWDQIAANNCVYGELRLHGEIADVYVVAGLEVLRDEVRRQFAVQEDLGVGHCRLVFYGVKAVRRRITPYSLDEMGRVVWGESTLEEHRGPVDGATNLYCLDGSHGEIRASVWMEVEAQKVSLHILSESEQ